MALIGIDNGNTTKMSRFANYLRNLLPSNDQVVMQMASKAMGRLALTGGTFTADYVEFEVKRALEWLGGDRNEGRRHAAVSTYTIIQAFSARGYILHKWSLRLPTITLILIFMMFSRTVSFCDILVQNLG